MNEAEKRCNRLLSWATIPVLLNIQPVTKMRSLRPNEKSWHSVIFDMNEKVK